jgi:putative transposase
MGYSTKFKLRVLKHARMGSSSIETVARLKKVPKQTIYRWMRLEQQFGPTGLENREPGTKPEQINVTFETVILATWNERQRGVHKLWLDTNAKGFGVSERQIQKIYKRHNLKMNKRTRPSQIKFVKYEWPKPNMLWHTDWTTCPFTGKQLIAFIDDHSRYLVHAEYFDNATTENTIKALENAITKQGKPEAILTDNGTQFTPARAVSGPFTRWCEERGIKHILGRVHHPQTNGKIERWFGTYKLEFKDGKDTLETFLKFYNEERLHQGIRYKVPLQRYKSNINAV